MAMRSRGSSSPSGGRSERSRTDIAIAGGLVVTCIATALALAGCKKTLDGGEDAFHLRMVNLLEDSPAVLYTVDTTAVTSAAYTAATPLGGVRPGDHTVSFAAIPPPTLVVNEVVEPTALNGSFTQTYTTDLDYTVFAYGTLKDVHAFVMSEPSGRPAVADDNIEWQIVNAAPNLPAADVFITAPDAQINTPQKVTTLAFGAKSTPATLKLFRRADVTDPNASLIADLVFELRDPATGAELYKSAKVRVTEQTRLLFAIAHNVGPGPSTVKIIGVDGLAGTLLDPDDQAAVRFVHASSDTPALDVARSSSLDTPIAQNIAFRGHSPYMKVPSGAVDLVATPAGSTNVFVFMDEFTALGDTTYSAYAVGPLASVGALVLTDNPRSVPIESQFRFLNAAPSQSGGNGLDIYVTLPGQALDFDSTDDGDFTDDATQFRRGAAVKFKGTTDYVVLKAGTYEVRVAATGTSKMLLDSTLALADGSVETVVINDNPQTGSLDLMPVEEALQ